MHDVVGQPQRRAQRTHLVLEEVVERLDQIEMHAVGEGDQVVVALDGRGLAAGLARAALDDVGVDGALRQVLHRPAALGQLLRDGEELLPELRADDAALLLRLHDVGQQRGVAVLGVHVHEVHVELLREHVLNFFGLVLAQQPVVMNTQVSCLPIAFAHSAATTEESTPPERPRITRSLPTCSRMAATASSMMESIVQLASRPQMPNRKFLSSWSPCGVWRTSGWNCVAYSRRSAHSIEATGHTSVEAVTVKPRRRLGYGVAVAHPHRLLDGRLAVQQGRPLVAPRQRRGSVLALLGVAHGAAQRDGHNLLAVAEAQHGNAQLEDAPDRWTARPRRTRWPARPTG